MLTRELMVVPEPPPQAVLDQRPWWKVTFMLLGLSCVLRATAMDVAGCLLSGVMLCFAVLMNRDGMSELSRYALAYGILSMMNLIFDLLPLAFTLSGRSETQVTDYVTDSPTSESFTVTATSHPFFDPGEGAAYNAQSLAMIVSPCAMLLGGYLAIAAHNEIQRTSALALFGQDDLVFRLDHGRRDAGESVIAARQMISAYGSLSRSDAGAGAGGSRAALMEAAARSQHQFQRFTGTAHKLDA